MAFSRDASIVLTTALALALVLALGAAVATADESVGDTGPTPPAVCDHLSEMDAARRALAEGDETRAVQHLRAARAMLVECERQGRAAERRAPVGPRYSI